MIGLIAFVAEVRPLVIDTLEMAPKVVLTAEKNMTVIANKTWSSLMTSYMFLERFGTTDIDIAFIAEMLVPFVCRLSIYTSNFCILVNCY